MTSGRLQTGPAGAARHGQSARGGALLEVDGLVMRYATRSGDVSAVEDVSFMLGRGEGLGLVGESGCGKTSIALAILRLLPDNGVISAGQIRLGGENLLALPEEAMRRRRWRDISMVFQGAMNAWNPVYRIGAQIKEALDFHWPQRLSDAQARERIAELLTLVDLDLAVADRYPHELSGGQRQRAVIAMALSCDPQLIIADEPTTALDVIVQDRILDKLKTIQRDLGTSMVYISHDIAVIAEVSDQVGVMYAGGLVEIGPTAEIYARPRHPYTRALLSSTPSVTGPRRRLAPLEGEPPSLLDPPTGCRFHPRCPLATGQCARQAPVLEPVAGSASHRVACWHSAQVPALSDQAPTRERVAWDAPKAAVTVPGAPLVQVEGLTKLFPIRKGAFRRTGEFVHAVDGVDLRIEAGERLGLVGESGCGKTTTGRILAKLTDATAGRILLRDSDSGGDRVVDVARIGRSERLRFRQRVQMIFQDPYESMNPRRTVFDTVAEPLTVQGIGTPKEQQERVADLLTAVGLAPARSYLFRYPHELSGGQRQRVAIARALVIDPAFVIADEPTSMLDVSIRISIMDLMVTLGRRFDVSYLFITHDLAVARYMCDRIAVMYLGKIVELAPTEALLADPLHPYTRALLSAVPVPDPTRRRPPAQLRGGVTTPINPEPHCRFLDRCPLADHTCQRLDHPPLEHHGNGHYAACYHPRSRQ